MDRVNWQYGESGGNKEVANYYAHTIQNLSTSLKYEDKMFEYANCGINRGIAENKRVLFEGTATNAYGDFKNKIRSNSNDLDATKINAQNSTAIRTRGVIEATIGALAGTTSDPTNGATNWVGHNKGIWAANNSKLNTTVTTVITTDKNGSGNNINHTFHELKIGSNSQNNVIKKQVDLSK
jgi:hypothetical protein